MPEGKFFDHEIDFLRDEIDYNLPNGDIPSIQNMLEPEELKYYNTQSLEDKGLVNSDINFALQKGFRFLQPSPFGTPWNPKLKLEHVGLTIPYTDSENCLYDTVKTIMNNLSMPTRIIIGKTINYIALNILRCMASNKFDERNRCRKSARVQIILPIAFNLS